MKGKLFVVAGPSGVGKGTICTALLKQRPQIGFSVSYITRGPRAGEIDGVSYHFVSETEFFAKRDAGEMLEFSRHNKGIWYGTPMKPVINRLEKGESVLLEIDDNGAKQVLSKYPEAISVFVLPPDKKTLIKRLVYRYSDDLEQLKPRIEKMPGEFLAARGYEYLILNDDVEKSINDMVDLFDGKYETPETLRQLLETLINESQDTVETLNLLEYYYQQAHEGDVK